MTQLLTHVSRSTRIGVSLRAFFTEVSPVLVLAQGLFSHKVIQRTSVLDDTLVREIQFASK